MPRKAAYFSDHASRMQDEPRCLQDDHTYALPDSKVLKRRNDVLVGAIEQYQDKLDISREREKRLRLCMSSALEKLKEQKILNEDLHVQLEAYSGIPVDLFDRPMKKYTQEQRDF